MSQSEYIRSRQSDSGACLKLALDGTKVGDSTQPVENSSVPLSGSRTFAGNWRASIACAKLGCTEVCEIVKPRHALDQPLIDRSQISPTNPKSPCLEGFDVGEKS